MATRKKTPARIAFEKAGKQVSNVKGPVGSKRRSNNVDSTMAAERKAHRKLMLDNAARKKNRKTKK
jgi:hypothetical protein